MKLKNISAVFILLLTSVGNAMSVTDAYLQVEARWSQNKPTSAIHQAYAKHIKRDAIAGLSEDDLNIFRSLIADSDVTSLDLNCRADLEESSSTNLKESSEVPINPICENGVKHVFGPVLKPRILNLTYANGMRRQVTVGLKKPASGFCSAIENQQGLFLTAVNTGNSAYLSEEANYEFHAQDASVDNILNAAAGKRISMALYRCCQPVDNGKQNCLEKMKSALKNQDANLQINSR